MGPDGQPKRGTRVLAAAVDRVELFGGRVRWVGVAPGGGKLPHPTRSFRHLDPPRWLRLPLMFRYRHGKRSSIDTSPCRNTTACIGDELGSRGERMSRFVPASTDAVDISVAFVY